MFVSFWDKIILWRLANVAVVGCRGSIARSAVRLYSHSWLCLLSEAFLILKREEKESKN